MECAFVDNHCVKTCIAWCEDENTRTNCKRLNIEYQKLEILSDIFKVVYDIEQRL